MVQLLWKTVRRFLKNLNIELPYDPAILLQGIYPKELKAGPARDMCAPMFIATSFPIDKRWKQPKCCFPQVNLPTDECRNKMWYTHTMKYYSA